MRCPTLVLAFLTALGGVFSFPSRVVAQDSPPAAGPDLVLSRAEVIRRALAHSPVVAEGTAALAVAGSAERVARGAFLPSLGINADALRSDQSIAAPAGATDAVTNYSTGVAASLDLFTGGRHGADLARAGADRRAADSDLIQRRFATRLTAEQAYFAVLRAHDLIVVGDARIRTAEQVLAAARRRAEAGTATRSDVLRGQLEHDAAQQSRLEAAQELLAATYALGRLVGVQGPADVRLDDSVVVQPLALSAAEVAALAAARAPVVLGAEEARRSGEAVVGSARSRYLPTLTGGGGYNLASETPLPGSVRPGWFLRLTMSYPLFDGFRREDAVTRAAAERDVAAVRVHDTRRLAGAEAARLGGAVEIAVARIALAESSVRSATEDLRVQQTRYAEGASSFLDLVTSQLALTQAREQRVALRYAYALAQAELEALLGEEL